MSATNLRVGRSTLTRIHFIHAAIKAGQYPNVPMGKGAVFGLGKVEVIPRHLKFEAVFIRFMTLLCRCFFAGNYFSGYNRVNPVKELRL